MVKSMKRHPAARQRSSAAVINSRSQPRFLFFRINRQQTEISSFPAKFNVYAAHECTLCFREQKLPFGQPAAHFLEIQAVLVNEKTFSAERGVHQMHDRFRIFGFRQPNWRWAHTDRDSKPS